MIASLLLLIAGAGLNIVTFLTYLRNVINIRHLKSSCSVPFLAFFEPRVPCENIANLTPMFEKQSQCTRLCIGGPLIIFL
jgi:hypothetical protein